MIKISWLASLSGIFWGFFRLVLIEFQKRVWADTWPRDWWMNWTRERGRIVDSACKIKGENFWSERWRGHIHSFRGKIFLMAQKSTPKNNSAMWGSQNYHPSLIFDDLSYVDYGVHASPNTHTTTNILLWDWFFAGISKTVETHFRCPRREKVKKSVFSSCFDAST